MLREMTTPPGPLCATELFVPIAAEITASNLRQWMGIEFSPDPEGDSDPDCRLELWLIVVELEGAMRIGHLEPGE
jgi:hypothetical protein